jgi:hypothetical protein
MYTPPSQSLSLSLSLCRPTVPSIAAARDNGRDGHSDKRTPLLRPSSAITAIFGEIGESGEQVRTLRESRNSLLYPTSCWVQWLIKEADITSLSNNYILTYT